MVIFRKTSTSGDGGKKRYVDLLKDSISIILNVFPYSTILWSHRKIIRVIVMDLINLFHGNTPKFEKLKPFKLSRFHAMVEAVAAFIYTFKIMNFVNI